MALLQWEFPLGSPRLDNPAVVGYYLLTPLASGRCTGDGFGRLEVASSEGGRNPDLILRDGGVGESAARTLRQEGRSLW